MWTFRTVHGLWSISRHEDWWVLMFNGERLAKAGTPSVLLLQVRRGAALKPVCGLDPAAANLPGRISGWQSEVPARAANNRIARTYPRLCAG